MTEHPPIPDMATTLRLLREAVAERGEDYVYPPAVRDDGCTYVDAETGEPSCLVGLVLHKAGWPLSLLQQADDSFGVAMWDFGAGRGMINAETDPVGRLLYEAQSRQDTRFPWGEAVEDAIAEVKMLRAEGLLVEGSAP